MAAIASWLALNIVRVTAALCGFVFGFVYKCTVHERILWDKVENQRC